MPDRPISVADAARGFSDLVHRAYHRGESAVLIMNGVPVARLVPPGPPRVTARELAERWRALRHLSPEDADRLATEIAAARATLPPAKPRWA